LVWGFLGVEDTRNDEGEVKVVIVFFALWKELSDTFGGCFQR
jgi:hypothetical protein